jgi:hypothetical protein
MICFPLQNLYISKGTQLMAPVVQTRPGAAQASEYRQLSPGGAQAPVF